MPPELDVKKARGEALAARKAALERFIHCSNLEAADRVRLATDRAKYEKLNAKMTDADRVACGLALASAQNSFNEMRAALAHAAANLFVGDLNISDGDRGVGNVRETEPNENALAIFKNIAAIPDSHPGAPNKSITSQQLSRFISNAFLASLHVEEGRQVRFKAILSADINLVQKITLPLTHPLPFEPSAIARIAPTSNFIFRRIVVLAASGDLQIIGFHDPELEKREWEHLCSNTWDESEFTIAVYGPGQIRIGWPVPLEYSRKNISTIRPLRDVQPVVMWFKSASQTLRSDPRVESHLLELFLRTWTRILERVRQSGHGGCFLFLPQGSDHATADLKVKFEVDWSILRQLLSSRIELEPEFSLHRFGDTDVPIEVIERSHFLGRDLSRACDLVASLASVDGAVVVSSDLRVIGFGTEISGLTNDCATGEFLDHSQILRRGHPDSAGPQRIDNFGMRHRSAFRFCQKNPGSIATVVSQDGDISVFFLGDSLVERFKVSTAYWPFDI